MPQHIESYCRDSLDGPARPQTADCANRIKSRSKPLTRVRRQFLLLWQAPTDFIAMWRNNHPFTRRELRRWPQPAKRRRDRLRTIAIGSIVICVILGWATGRAGAVHGLDY